MLSSGAQEDAKHLTRECSTVMRWLQSPQNFVMLNLSFLTREEGVCDSYGYILILEGSASMMTL